MTIKNNPPFIPSECNDLKEIASVTVTLHFEFHDGDPIVLNYDLRPASLIFQQHTLDFRYPDTKAEVPHTALTPEEQDATPSFINVRGLMRQ